MICRYATPETEEELLELTRELTPQEIARACRQAGVTEQKQALEDRKERYVRTWWSEDDRFLNVAGQIPGVDGVVVEKALRRLTVKAPRDPLNEYPVDPQAAQADALVQMASQSIASDGDADLATVVIHADATALAGASGTLAAGDIALDLTGVLRAACDARVQLLVESSDGSPLGVGRTRRTIPAWMRRILRKRDGHCRFPGCERSRWVHMHHIQHWAHGGPTDVDNLVMLCGFHHRVVHDDGWTIEGDPDGELRFVNKFGLPHRPIRDDGSPTTGSSFSSKESTEWPSTNWRR